MQYACFAKGAGFYKTVTPEDSGCLNAALWYYWPTRIFLLEAEPVRAVQIKSVTASPATETSSANDKTRADLDSDPK